MVEGEGNRVKDRPQGEHHSHGLADEGEDAGQTQTQRPEIQEVTDRPRESSISKRKVIRNVKCLRSEGRGFK